MDLLSLAQAADGGFDDSPFRHKYGEATVDLIGAPTYDNIDYDDHDLVMRNLHYAQMHDNWDDFIGYLHGVEEKGHRPNNKFAPIYPIGESHSDKGHRGFDCPENYRKLCDEDMAEFTREVAPDYALPILLRWVDLLPIWEHFGLCKGGDARGDDYLWSPVRVLLSGAGYKHWRVLAQACENVFETCPFDPEETDSEWHKKMIDAHKQCGWPIQLIHIPFPRMLRWYPTTIPSVAPPAPQWGPALALLHILKHCRVDPDGVTRILHGGLRTVVATPMSGYGADPKILKPLTQTLGCPAPNPKTWVNPLYDCLRGALNMLGSDNLLRTRPLSALPKNVFAGQWSRLECLGGTDEFTQTGLQVTGVKYADHGHIRELVSDEDDVLGYAWNIADSTSAENLELRRRYYDELPPTYEIGLPMDIFAEAFQQVEIPTGCDPDAYFSLLESPILASVLRDDWKPLRSEFPFVGLLPALPSQDHSTNQGKSTALRCYARSLVPGIELVNAPDSSSAPDTRSIGTHMSTYGTVALDEFVMPRSLSHPLAKNSLQTLCTGGQLNSGRILKDFGLIRLEHSIILSAKFLELPPDMVNRSLLLFLGNLTDEMRDRWATEFGEDSDQISLAMRLAAMAIVEDEEFWPRLRQIPVASRHYLRFGAHRAIAAAMYGFRTGVESIEECLKAVDETYHILLGRYHAQTDMAEEEGLIRDAELGRVQSLRLATLCEGLQMSQLTEIRASCLEGGSQRGGRFCTKDLIRALVEAHSKNTEQLVRSVSELSGIKWVGEPQISRALGKDLSARANRLLLPTKDVFEIVTLPEPFVQSPWALAKYGSGWRWINLDED